MKTYILSANYDDLLILKKTCEYDLNFFKKLLAETEKRIYCINHSDIRYETYRRDLTRFSEIIKDRESELDDINQRIVYLNFKLKIA